MIQALNAEHNFLYTPPTCEGGLQPANMIHMVLRAKSMSYSFYYYRGANETVSEDQKSSSIGELKIYTVKNFNNCKITVCTLASLINARECQDINS